jgi:hypothetical protein
MPARCLVACGGFILYWASPQHAPRDDATPAAITSERWPASDRKRWRVCIGIPGRLHRIRSGPPAASWDARTHRGRHERKHALGRQPRDLKRQLLP